MSFRDFTLPKLQHDFSLTVDPTRVLFANVPSVPLSQTLRMYLEDYGPLGVTMPTEKARSEVLVSPFLSEVWKRADHRIGVFSGVEFNVEDAMGLTGICDFLLSRSPQLLFIEAPILCLVEAKKDNIADGLGQCGAEMVAAQRFNQKAGTPIDPIYGCVTTGANWRFLRLSDCTLAIDLNEYSITQPDRILGVLLYCCGVATTT